MFARLLVLSFALLMITCGGGPSPSSTSTVASIKVAGPGLSTDVALGFAGETSQLSAQVIDSTGTSIQFVTNQASWQSSNTAVASVSATGLVTAVGAGQTSVSATYQGKTGTLQASVNFARVVPILIWSPSVFSPTVRITFQGRSITAQGYYVFNLQPGSYELSGTLGAGASWVVMFSTTRAIGNPPPISDNGVQLGSISATGSSPTLFRNNCEVDFAGDGDFRITFTVTASRASGATCPILQ